MIERSLLRMLGTLGRHSGTGRRRHVPLVQTLVFFVLLGHVGVRHDAYRIAGFQVFQLTFAELLADDGLQFFPLSHQGLIFRRGFAAVFGQQLPYRVDVVQGGHDIPGVRCRLSRLVLDQLRCFILGAAHSRHALVSQDAVVPGELLVVLGHLPSFELVLHVSGKIAVFLLQFAHGLEAGQHLVQFPAGEDASLESLCRIPSAFGQVGWGGTHLAVVTHNSLLETNQDAALTIFLGGLKPIKPQRPFRVLGVHIQQRLDSPTDSGHDFGRKHARILPVTGDPAVSGFIERFGCFLGVAVVAHPQLGQILL